MPVSSSTSRESLVDEREREKEEGERTEKKHFSSLVPGTISIAKTCRAAFANVRICCEPQDTKVAPGLLPAVAQDRVITGNVRCCVTRNTT